MLPNNMAHLLGIPSDTILNVTIVNDNAVGAKSSVTKSKHNVVRALKRQKSFESLHGMPAQPRRGIQRQSTPYPIKRPITSVGGGASSTNGKNKAEQQVLSRWGEERPSRTITQSNTTPKSDMLRKPTRSSDSLLELMAFPPSGGSQDHLYAMAVPLRPNVHRWGEEQPSHAATHNNTRSTDNRVKHHSQSNDSLLELLVSSANAVQDHSFPAAVLLSQNHHHEDHPQWASAPPKQPIRATLC